MRRDKGITLIALIITIIVMLILAGVALTTFTGEGSIIENAETVVGEYNNSVKGEQALLNTIEKYLENYTNGGEVVDEDKNKPIVTVAEGEETIEEGADNEISKYFTIDQNGTSPIKTIIYTDTSNEDVEVTNTNTLSVGTHIIRCTVTKETGLSSSVTKTIIVESNEPVIVGATDIANAASEHFGGYVTNYLAPSGDPNVGWRIFYADESNIYLIADDYIHYNYAPTSANYTLYKDTDYKLSFSGVLIDYDGSKDITDPRIKKWISYVSGNPDATGEGIQSVAFMLDETRWSAKYANTTYAEYAIGGPTIELWCASYKKTHPENYVESTYNATGYQVRWNGGSYSESITGADDYKDLYYIKSSTEKCNCMWLASPSAFGSYSLMDVGFDGDLRTTYFFYYHGTGFRPLVCLESGIQLEKQSDGTYLIK